MWQGLGLVLFNIWGNDLEGLGEMLFRFADNLSLGMRTHCLLRETENPAESNIRDMKNTMGNLGWRS